MNSEQIVLTAVFVAGMLILLLAPFYPTWKEWMFPTDVDPMPLEEPLSSGPLEQDTDIHLSEGCVFQQLDAPTIRFGRALQQGHVSVVGIRGLTPVYATLDMSRLPGAQVWGSGWRVEGDCHVPHGSEIMGPLVVTGRLSLGRGCLVHGDTMVHRDLHADHDCVLLGSVFCDGSIHLGAAAKVKGPIIAGKGLHVQAGGQLGDPQNPTSVMADQIEVASGVIAHGSIWASNRGSVGAGVQMEMTA